MYYIKNVIVTEERKGSLIKSKDIPVTGHGGP
jgi:hypothetical protein